MKQKNTSQSPIHLNPSRYSETSKQIYLIDVDQRTLFSLQAVINDSVMVILQMMIEPMILTLVAGGFFQPQLAGAW